MSVKKLTKRHQISIERREASFDRACESAIALAMSHWGVDACGHITRVRGSERSTDAVRVEFMTYTSWGHSAHLYVFETWVERNEDK